jgi:DNA-binding transcriptional regulator LsrR (DeoR family)
MAAEVARLFFDRQLSKVEIGGRLGISRFRVARLIERALAEDLVRIEFRDIPAVDRELARTIEERFELDLCVVAGAGQGDAATRVARLGGSVVGELIGRGDVVGIAWGSTLAAVVAEIPARDDASIEVVQLAGSSIRLNRRQDPGELARSLADRLGAGHHPLHGPTFVDDPTLRAALLGQPDLAATVAAFDRLTLAIVGIGAMPAGDHDAESSLIRSGVLTETEVAGLVRRGAVGDLVVHAFDAAGTFVAADLAERAIAIPVEQLRRVPRVVAVAAGRAKTAAIRGALVSGIVRVLVTDTAAAEGILAEPATVGSPTRARERAGAPRGRA